MRILILIAHPDDEIIMSGGTIDKAVRRGYEVTVSYYTKNEEAYFAKETQIKRKERTVKEASLCANYLGFGHNFLGFRDMHVEENKALLLKATIKEIRRVRPDIIITHIENDKHIDHRTIAQIVPEANFQSGCKLCGGNTIWSASAVLQGEINLEMTTLFEYSIVSEISEENFKKKLKAFNYYKSVMKEHNTEKNWLFDKLLYSAKLRGKSVGSELGEAFFINNYVPLNSSALSLVAELIK